MESIHNKEKLKVNPKYHFLLLIVGFILVFELFVFVAYTVAEDFTKIPFFYSLESGEIELPGINILENDVNAIPLADLDYRLFPPYERIIENKMDIDNPFSEATSRKKVVKPIQKPLKQPKIDANPITENDRFDYYVVSPEAEILTPWSSIHKADEDSLPNRIRQSSKNSNY
jgi:hypothetical protein